jgi:anthranilate synthase/aminodeoxychorismate synthase-like glutamine amidotransferase
VSRVLVVDNYDSFTYNIAQELGVLGATVEVARNDAFTVEALLDDLPDGIVISPGPGTPADAGLSGAVIEAAAGRRPVLGICLGHQCIADVYGGRVVPAPEIVHGKTSPIYHRREGVLTDLPVPFDATRYHSLVVERDSLPSALKVTAETTSGIVMALRHREHVVEGVQFHPESVLTGVGMRLFRNFLATCARIAEDAGIP